VKRFKSSIDAAAEDVKEAFREKRAHPQELTILCA
jgi:hypothetical protein